MKTLVMLESLLLAILMTLPPLVILIILYMQQSMTLFNILMWVLVAFVWTVLIAIAYAKRRIKLILK